MNMNIYFYIVLLVSRICWVIYSTQEILDTITVLEIDIHIHILGRHCTLLFYIQLTRMWIRFNSCFQKIRRISSD